MFFQLLKTYLIQDAPIISPNKDWFNTYQHVDDEKVLMGSNVASKVVGRHNSN